MPAFSLGAGRVSMETMSIPQTHKQPQQPQQSPNPKSTLLKQAEERVDTAVAERKTAREHVRDDEIALTDAFMAFRKFEKRLDRERGRSKNRSMDLCNGPLESAALIVQALRVRIRARLNDSYDELSEADLKVEEAENTVTAVQKLEQKPASVVQAKPVADEQPWPRLERRVLKRSSLCQVDSFDNDAPWWKLEKLELTSAFASQERPADDDECWVMPVSRK
jgi:hypothetical protein